MRTFRVNKLIVVMLVFTFILTLLTSCKNGNKENAEPKELTKITICQWGQALIYLPLYIAVHENYFEDEGLDVKVINGGGDDLTWAAVTSGNAQFGIADPVMIAIQAEQGGVPGRIVGDIVGKVAFWAITLDKEMDILREPKDFKGQTIACFKFPNTAHALALKTIQKGNLEPGKDIKIVEVNYGAVLAQLKRGEATLAMVLEPAASLAVSQGAKVIYSYPKDWGVFAFTGLTTTEKFMREKPEIVQKVVNALQKAMRLAHTNFEKVVECGQKAFPDLELSVIRAAVKRMLEDGTLPKNITPNSKGWEKAIKVAVEVKKLKDAANTNKMLDKSFAIKAVEKWK